MERWYYITSRHGFFKATAKAYAPKWTRDKGLAYCVKSWDEAAATQTTINMVSRWTANVWPVTE